MAGFSDDLKACAELVHRGDPDRFLAAMAAPVAARRVLFPLYAMNVEVSRAPWVTAEPMIARMRLQWWREALQEIAGGGMVRRHPVVTPLAEVLPGGLARSLDELVVVRHWDIERESFCDRAQFDRHIDQGAGTLMWVAARLLGQCDESVARDIGYAAGLANWLQAVSELRARGRRPLLDDAPDAVRALARDGLMRLKRARTGRIRVSKAAGPALLAGWRAGAVLRQAARDPERVMDGTLGQSEARRRLSLMARAATGRW